MSFFFNVQVLVSPAAGQAEVGNMALLSLGDILKWVSSLECIELPGCASPRTLLFVASFLWCWAGLTPCLQSMLLTSYNGCGNLEVDF